MNTGQESIFDRVMMGFIPLKYFLMFFIITIAGVYFNATPKGFLGGFMLCTIFGIALEKLGDNIPIIKDYFGGGPFVTIFAAAAIVYFGWMPEATMTQIQDFVKPMDYIGLIVGALICGSILTMDKKLLIRAGSLYVIPIIGAIVCAFGLTGVIGMLMGFGWKEAIMFVALPIMGGGTSAGAVPLSQMYGSVLSQDSSYYLSLIMPAVGIGNALAIVAAGFLDRLGKKAPSMTGNGVLMHGFELDSAKDQDRKMDYGEMGIGFLITAMFFTIGIILSKFMPMIHYYAWTIICVAVAKITGAFPSGLEGAIKQWYLFLQKISIPAVLFGIGFVYTDLNVVFSALTPTYFILVLTTIIGAIVGAGVLGKVVGFYVIEAAITAGLCMANMGGSGDLATLGAAKRMELMPFSQISSRIGGAIILVISSILAGILGAGL
jgi:Na+/citrate or Na+/malate symporter